MKTKLWILVIAAALLLCGVFSVLLLSPTQADAAHIFSDGSLVRTVSLAVDQEFTVELAGGTNTVTVRDGKLAVTAASCPDHYCMKRGFCAGGAQIVCLPNKLVIRFTSQQAVDGAVG